MKKLDIILGCTLTVVIGIGFYGLAITPEDPIPRIYYDKSPSMTVTGVVHDSTLMNKPAPKSWSKFRNQLNLKTSKGPSDADIYNAYYDEWTSDPEDEQKYDPSIFDAGRD